MDLNWYKVFDAGQQTIKERHAQADNHRLAKQIDKQPIHWGIRLPQLSQPAPVSRRLRRARL